MIDTLVKAGFDMTPGVDMKENVEVQWYQLGRNMEFVMDIDG